MLDLTGCTFATDASIEEIVRNCPQLRALHLAYTHLENKTIETIEKYGSRLVKLDLGGHKELTDELIQCLTQKCPNIRELNLNGCCALTDTAITAISRSYPELRALTLGHCTNVSEEAIKTMAQGCPKLSKLDLIYTHVTNDAIKAIAECCPHLRELFLAGCNNIDVSSLSFLGELPELQTLWLPSQTLEGKRIKQFFNPSGQ